MALTSFGFIVRGEGLDPRIHRTELRSSCFRMLTVGVSDVAAGPAAARALLDEGVQLIELCGAFGPEASAAVLAEVAGAVPIGAVSYGAESIDALHALFARQMSD